MMSKAGAIEAHGHSRCKRVCGVLFHTFEFLYCMYVLFVGVIVIIQSLKTDWKWLGTKQEYEQGLMCAWVGGVIWFIAGSVLWVVHRHNSANEEWPRPLVALMSSVLFFVGWVALLMEEDLSTLSRSVAFRTLTQSMLCAVSGVAFVWLGVSMLCIREISRHKNR